MIYDPNPVTVTYTDDELRVLIENYISKQESVFSYRDICHYVLETAKREGRVPNADYTQYSSNDLNPWSDVVLSRIIWEYIWYKKIFIVFGNNPYSSGNLDDVRLFKYVIE